MNRKQHNQVKGNGQMNLHNFMWSNTILFERIKLRKKSVFERVFGNLFR